MESWKGNVWKDATITQAINLTERLWLSTAEGYITAIILSSTPCLKGPDPNNEQKNAIILVIIAAKVYLSCEGKRGELITWNSNHITWG